MNPRSPWNKVMQMTMSKDEIINEYEKCLNDFPYFCANYLQIFNVEMGLVDFALFQFQEEIVYPAYEKYRFNIIRKFRQAGLSTMTAAYVLWKAIFLNDQSILVVSKSDREAMSFMRIVREFYRCLPDWLTPPATKNNDHWLEFESNKSKIMAFTPVAGRSITCTLLVVDEAAFIKKMDEHWASMFPTISTGGRCIVISTVNGTVGDGKWYHDQYSAAMKGENDFNAINLSYKDHPQYNTEKWVSQQKRQLGEKRFRQEVLGDFEGSVNTYISNEALVEMANNITRPGWTRYRDKLWIWEPPQPGVQYLIAVDVAEGLGNDLSTDMRVDNSAFHIFREDNMEQVAELYSNSVDVIELSNILAVIGNWYGGATIAVENNGIGGSVLHLLQSVKQYNNLYWGSGNRPGFVMSGNKSRLLNKMKICIETGVVKIRSERTLHELRRLEWDEKRQRTRTPHAAHDDLIVPLAIAVWVRDEKMAGMPPGYVASNASQRALIQKAIDAHNDYETSEMGIEQQLESISRGTSDGNNAMAELFYFMNSPEGAPAQKVERETAGRPKSRYLRGI